MPKKIACQLFTSAASNALAAAAGDIAAGDRYRKVPFLDHSDATGRLARGLDAVRRALPDAGPSRILS
jgi:hypothetical protein